MNYTLEIKNQENVIILVDTSNTPCASDLILYKRDHDHYRVDAEKIHSYVFYQKKVMVIIGWIRNSYIHVFFTMSKCAIDFC